MKTRAEVARLIRASETPEAMAEVVGQAVDEYEATIARLRRIEEAAEYLLAQIDHSVDSPLFAYDVAALRAELEADR